MNYFKTAAATAAIAIMPFAASAATVFTQDADLSADVGYSFSGTTSAGQSGGNFNFTVLEDFSINGFSLTASGTSSGTDIENTTYEITDPLDEESTFGFILTTGTSSFGAAGVEGVTEFSAGDTFSVLFNTAPDALNPISYTVSFLTEAPAPVPVPAAGLLLLTALGGTAAMRRRKKA